MVGDLPAKDTVGLSTEEWMISLTRTGHRCFIRLVKAVPELDDLIPVLLPIKLLTASTDFGDLRAGAATPSVRSGMGGSVRRCQLAAQRDPGRPDHQC
jgi:hypothetical protein